MTLASPQTRREAILKAAIDSGLLHPEAAPLAAFIDVDGVAENVAALQEAFPGEIDVQHAFAAKANSVVPVLAGLRHLGMGCEVASAGELAQALRAGFEPQHIIFDSPAKSRQELKTALSLGVAVNIDNLQELGRVDQLMHNPTDSRIGIRVNPQVGVGGIAEMSTAGLTSKFGVALADPVDREALLKAYAERPWLTRIHAHVGSQGCPLPLIGEGLRILVDFADQVNDTLGTRQITGIDIGGGLPVDFETDTAVSDFAAYVAQLRQSAPRLFSGDYMLVTEFGRSIMAKFGFTAAYVEYTKVAGGQHIAITHAGANVATRTVFMPDAWPLRISVHGPDGSGKTGKTTRQDVAGPCCFAGDIVARDRALPLLHPGDIVLLLDTGAYYSSTPFTYNSIPEPGVYGASIDEDGKIHFSVLRKPQTMEQLLEASGAALVAHAQQGAWGRPCEAAPAVA